MKVQSVEFNKKSLMLSVLKGSVFALCFCLVAILVFAFILRFVPVSDGIISPINQVIKTISIFFGVMLSLKKQKTQGLISGLCIGVAFSILSFLCFSILDGSFNFLMSTFCDVLFAALIGGICGIIAVNVKRR